MTIAKSTHYYFIKTSISDSRFFAFMMKKSISVFGVLFFIVHLMIAQHKISIYVGPTISYLTNIYGIDDYARDATINKNFSFRTYPSEGMHFGLSSTYSFGKKWRLCTKLGYVGMGMKAVELSYIPNYTEPWWISKIEKKNYIQLCPSIGYQLNTKIGIFLGVQAQYLYGSENYFGFRQRTFSLITGQSFQEFNDIYGNIDFHEGYSKHKKLDIGISFGLSYRLSKFFAIDIHTYRGFLSHDILESLPPQTSSCIRRNVNYGAALVVDIPRWKKETIPVVTSKKLKIKK